MISPSCISTERLPVFQISQKYGWLHHFHSFLRFTGGVPLFYSHTSYNSIPLHSFGLVRKRSNLGQIEVFKLCLFSVLCSLMNRNRQNLPSLATYLWKTESWMNIWAKYNTSSAWIKVHVHAFYYPCTCSVYFLFHPQLYKCEQLQLYSSASSLASV